MPVPTRPARAVRSAAGRRVRARYSGPPRPVVLGVMAFVLTFVVFGCWSLAIPLGAAPDEGDHIAKAAALVHGQWVGQPVPDPSPFRQIPDSPFTTVRVSPELRGVTDGVACYQKHLDVPASCAGHGPEPTSGVMPIYVGRYPPLYYAIVGLPALLSAGRAAVYSMRLVSDVLCALVLALGFAVASSFRRPGLACLGLAVAVTPPAMFLGASVNPNGLEICAAAALWAAGLVIVSDRGSPVHRWQVVVATLLACVLISMRGLSPVFGVIIGCALVVIAGRHRAARLARSRSVRVGLGVLTVVGVAAIVWIVAAHTLRLAPTGERTGSDGLLRIFGRAVQLAWQQAPGVAGLSAFAELYAPPAAFVLWLIAGGFLLFAAIVTGRRQQRRGLLIVLALLALMLVLPAVATTAKAREYGIIEQARYTMPLTVGIAPVAVSVIGTRARWVTAGAAIVAGLLGAALFVDYAAVLRRFSSGVHGPLLTAHTAWEPPGGGITWLAVMLVALIGYAALIAALSVAAPSAGSHPAPPGSVILGHGR